MNSELTMFAKFLTYWYMKTVTPIHFFIKHTYTKIISKLLQNFSNSSVNSNGQWSEP